MVDMEALTVDDVTQILRVEVGSTAHGTGLGPTVEDHDEMAIAIEPVAWTLGIRTWKGTIIHRPGRRHDERSGPGDLDLTVHSLRKWAQLAARGNPSILLALWAPILDQTPLGALLRDQASMFVSRQVAGPFLGYAQAQRQRLLGQRGGAHTNRPELVQVHGYDTKYAMHMVRLALQGNELMMTGAIEFPARSQRLLLDIRQGKYSLAEVVEMAEQYEGTLKRLADHADLPAGPDLIAIDRFVVSAYQSVYQLSYTTA
jgi:predicted nucleotidyltransferase